MSLFEKLNAAKQAKLKQNLDEGLAFLAENAKREGVITLPSGLQYEIIQNTNAEKPSIYHEVSCHYEGKLVNGKVFDSSIQRGRPAKFGVNQVIAGWTEALQLMSKGSKWRLFIPPHLAYGEEQMGALIQPNSTLIFEVELLGF